MQSPDEPQQTSNLIDHVYAALFGEAPWQGFLDGTRDLLPDGQTVLLYHDKSSRTGAFTMAAGLDPGIVQRYNSHYHALNPWTDHALIRPLRRVMQADEMLPREDLLRTPFFNEYLRERGVVTGLGVTFRRDENRDFFFSIVCANVDEERLNRAKRTITALTPHLARTSGAFGPGAMERAGSGTLRINAKLKVMSVDGQALALLEESEALRIGPLGRLICKDANVLRLLQQMLASGLDAPLAPAVQYCHLKCRNGALPLRAWIYRPGLMTRDLFGGMDCFIRIDTPERTLHEGARQFGALHHLSISETNIVQGLVEGLTIELIARARRTSPDTVRTQLKSIYAKTGCARQADIVRHVAAMANPWQ